MCLLTKKAKTQAAQRCPTRKNTKRIRQYVSVHKSVQAYVYNTVSRTTTLLTQLRQPLRPTTRICNVSGQCANVTPMQQHSKLCLNLCLKPHVLCIGNIKSC